jgi:hypothetical protein
MRQYIRRLILPTIFLSLLVCCKTLDRKVEISILKSTSKTLTYSVNGDTFSNSWTISPELKPDRLNVECINEQNPVSFFSDIDSISFNVKLNDTIRFIVLLNSKDSALTEIIGVPKNTNFSAEYIREHKGKFAVEIPEVHELANILTAISKIGQLDSNMVDMTTPYHKEVLKYFSPYSNHPIIDTINRYVTGILDNQSYWYYYALKMNACGYVFDNDGHIVNKGIIRKMGFGGNDDPLVENKKLMEDFARKSNFREFYKNHQSYYDSLLILYQQLNPIDKMQKWLEKKFEFEYGNYTVLFSPLVGGAHSTTRFKDNDFEQTFMFVCRAENAPEYNQNVNEMRESRVVFTEIDHNFVNPISDKKIDIINKVFADRNKWTKEGNGTSSYESAYDVFNEYMTWALFSLYCLDNFPNNDARQFIQKMEKQMTNSRNFIKFKEFNQQLIKIYKDNPNINMNDLYDKVLKWCMDEK